MEEIISSDTNLEMAQEKEEEELRVKNKKRERKRKRKNFTRKSDSIRKSNIDNRYIRRRDNGYIRRREGNRELTQKKIIDENSASL